jgi:hypothetical protein
MTPVTAAIDPAILNGWSIRSNNWQIGASVQQDCCRESRSRSAISGGG